jgi:pyruvate,water dikinase
MEVGGVMCHAAIVAREIGLPAVFGARGATRLLRDGQRVEVEGRAGTVRVVEDDAMGGGEPGSTTAAIAG